MSTTMFLLHFSANAPMRSQMVLPKFALFKGTKAFDIVIREEQELHILITAFALLSHCLHPLPRRHPRLYEVEEGSEGHKRAGFCHLACGLGKYLFIKVE